MLEIGDASYTQEFGGDMNAGISTGALRQIAQWLDKRPSESVVVLVYRRIAKATIVIPRHNLADYGSPPDQGVR